MAKPKPVEPVTLSVGPVLLNVVLLYCIHRLDGKVYFEDKGTAEEEVKAKTSWPDKGVEEVSALQVGDGKYIILPIVPVQAQ